VDGMEGDVSMFSREILLLKTNRNFDLAQEAARDVM